ncbi:MAG: tripartite tricarboxylate transporter substrate binding protein [Xanthobacteraceae bacterium]|nr:tripartite tricarboxylate transporter substrate binding protein [Xanthobacteraceae bacterium]
MQSIGFFHRLIGAAVALAVIAGVAPAQAQDDAANYPNKPIRVIVPFAAGGGNDIFARLVGHKLSEILGQQLVIENRPAAGGRPAAEYVSNQPADGYTLFVGASGVMSIASAVFPKLAYHPTKSFIPLSMIANFPLILVSPVENPSKTVMELVAFAKANPDKANYGTTSPAFTISTELLKLKTGMPGVAIPLKSSNEMILCVMQQQCLLSISDGPPAIPQINAGKVRALAVTGAERSPQLPNVPSMAESGLPEVNTKLWSGFFAPAKTPPAIAAKLEAALRKAITDPGVSAKLREMAVTPGGTASADFRKMIDADIQSYVEVVKAANLKFE